MTLSLSTTTTGSPGDFTIASATTKVRLKAGKQARLTLSAKQVSASVPAGTYHVLVSVTDPDGSKTTVDTGKTLTVQAPQPKAPRSKSEGDDRPGGGTTGRAIHRRVIRP